jgi:hypothetical protein
MPAIGVARVAMIETNTASANLVSMSGASTNGKSTSGKSTSGANMTGRFERQHDHDSDRMGDFGRGFRR